MATVSKKFVSVSSLCLLLMLVSACGLGRENSDPMAPEGSIHKVSAPEFEISDVSTKNQRPLIGVGSISVVAPMKGYEIVSMRGTIKTYGQVDPIRTKYLFDESAEASVQQALSHLFEVEPGAKKLSTLN